MRWVIILCLFLAACSAQQVEESDYSVYQKTDNSLLIIATTIPEIADVVSDIVGEKAKVFALTDTNVSLDENVLAQLRQADVLITVGGGYQDLEEQALALVKLPTIDASTPIDFIEVSEVQEDNFEYTNTNVFVPPHDPSDLAYVQVDDEYFLQEDVRFWLSVKNMQLVVDYVAGELSKRFVEHRREFMLGSQLANNRLDELDSRFNDALNGCQGVISAAAPIAYLADDYGFENVLDGEFRLLEYDNYYTMMGNNIDHLRRELSC